MAKITIKQISEQSGIAAKLVRAVIKQMGGKGCFEQSAQDVARYGIDGGFGGFIYYSDTVAFTKRNKAAILELCRNQAREYCQSGSVSEFLSHFGCLKGESMADIEEGLYNSRSDNQTTIYNALAWYAGEEVCRAYCDIMGRE